MIVSPIWSYLVVIAAIGVLIYAAISDLKNFTIRNSLVLALAGLYLLHAVVAGRWAGMGWDLGLAAAMFAITLVFYGLGLLGGGDVKLLAVAFLWVGMAGAMAFAVLLMICCFVYAVAGLFRWVPVRQQGRRRQIPFAPAVAAALIGTFLLGAVQPWPWDVQRELSRPQKLAPLHTLDLKAGH